jgi:TPR repeat protein
MDNHSENMISAARRSIELGDYSGALLQLRPLLDSEVPEALFIFSTFSIAGTETDSEFERRSLKLLRRASELGYPPAIYALGVCYEAGDLISADLNKAATLFEAAARLGYSKAKFRFGLNVFYGTAGTPRDEESGLRLIREAAGEGVEEAHEYLESKGQP